MESKNKDSDGENKTRTKRTPGRKIPEEIGFHGKGSSDTMMSEENRTEWIWKEEKIHIHTSTHTDKNKIRTRKPLIFPTHAHGARRK